MRLDRVVAEIKFLDHLIGEQKERVEQDHERAIAGGRQRAPATTTASMEAYNAQKNALVLEYLKTAVKVRRDLGLEIPLTTIEEPGDLGHIRLKLVSLTEPGLAQRLTSGYPIAFRVNSEAAYTRINVARLNAIRKFSDSAASYTRIAERICKILQIHNNQK